MERFFSLIASTIHGAKQLNRQIVIGVYQCLGISDFAHWLKAKPLRGVFLIFLLGCSSATPSIDTELGRKALKDEVRTLLTVEDCASAIEKIEKLYLSEHSDNETRLLRASAYMCSAGINLLELFQDLIDESRNYNFSGSGLWAALTKLFPSVSSDQKAEAGGYTLDALHATLKADAAVADDDQYNWATVNPASADYNDRVGEANVYMTFTSMMVIGALQNRYGSPNASYQKTTDLPWDTEPTMTTDGCLYAGAILNMADGLSSTAASNASISTIISNISVLTLLFDIQCALGCATCAATDATISCSACPNLVRSRTLCMASKKARCAAAGLVDFINNSPAGWN